MDEKTGESRKSTDDQMPGHIESPSEKLEEDTPTGSLVPGSENPESKEVKNEKSPNTE